MRLNRWFQLQSSTLTENQTLWTYFWIVLLINLEDSLGAFCYRMWVLILTMSIGYFSSQCEVPHLSETRIYILIRCIKTQALDTSKTWLWRHQQRNDIRSILIYELFLCNLYRIGGKNVQIDGIEFASIFPKNKYLIPKLLINRCLYTAGILLALDARRCWYHEYWSNKCY